MQPYRLMCALLLAGALSACGDDSSSGDTEGQDESSTSNVTSDTADSGDTADTADTSGVSGDNYMRGTFEGIDGVKTPFEAATKWNTATFGGKEIANCEGSTDDRLLAVTFAPSETAVGPVEMLDLLEAPYYVLGWPQSDGTGSHGTASQKGTLTFTEFGTESGDVVAGFGEVELHPMEDDPDDLYQGVLDVEFRCTVP